MPGRTAGASTAADVFSTAEGTWALSDAPDEHPATMASSKPDNIPVIIFIGYITPLPLRGLAGVGLTLSN